MLRQCADDHAMKHYCKLQSHARTRKFARYLNEAPDKKSWKPPLSSCRIGFNDKGVFLHEDHGAACAQAILPMDVDCMLGSGSCQAIFWFARERRTTFGACSKSPGAATDPVRATLAVVGCVGATAQVETQEAIPKYYRSQN